MDKLLRKYFPHSLHCEAFDIHKDLLAINSIDYLNAFSRLELTRKTALLKWSCAS